MMYREVSKSDFRDAFRRMDRHNGWTYEGLGALYDYMDEIDEECNEGKGWELDVIALCCDFTEYSDLEDWKKDYYGEDFEPDIETLDELRDHTTVIEFDGGIIVGAF